MKNLVKTITAALLVSAGFASASHAGTTVRVNLWDAADDIEMSSRHRIRDGKPRYEDTMGLMTSTATVPAGEVTFNVTNTSSGLVHEMVIGQLDGPGGILPYDPNIARVDESIEGAKIEEVPELEPGASGTLTMNMTPGTYVLYCNIQGHYGSGMWVILTVV